MQVSVILYSSNQCRCGETADALDSKSSGGNTVWVQIPPPAPYIFCEERFIVKWVLSIFLFFIRKIWVIRHKELIETTVSTGMFFCMTKSIAIY